MRFPSELPRFAVAIEPLHLQLVDPFTISRGTEQVRPNLLVRVRYSGEEGLGECSPNRRYGEDEISASRSILRAAEKIVDLRPDLGLLGRELTRELGGRDLSARAGLEMALYDVIGKLGGLTAAQLLALDPPRPIETSFTIAIAQPAEMARRARAARDFHILKVKVGDGPSLDGLAAVRLERPDARMSCDANEGWSREVALANLPRLVELGVEWLEQPLAAGDHDGLASLRGKGVQIMADESLVVEGDLERLAGKVDGVNVKVAKVGGMAPAARMLARARELGFTTMTGCMIESSLGIGSAVELSSLVDLADLDGHLLIRDDPFVGVLTRGGVLTRAEGPGLAVRKK